MKTMLPLPADTPEAIRDEFNRLAGLMGAAATAADSMTLLLLATAWTTWRSAQFQVAAQGTVVMSGGVPVAHPALTVAAQAQQQILQLSRKLGLTPASRGKRRSPMDGGDVDALLALGDA